MRIFVAAVAMASVGVFAAGPAVAHDDQGLMTAETRPGPGATSVTARTRLVFANDGHPTDAAMVTVSGSSLNGAQVGPTPLTSVGDGEYEGVVELPASGDWSFQFTAANPVATATANATVTAPTTAPPATEPRRAAASEAADDESSGLNPAVIALGGAVVVAALVAGVVVLRRRR
jgi:hypothetical protein